MITARVLSLQEPVKEGNMQMLGRLFNNEPLSIANEQAASMSLAKVLNVKAQTLQMTLNSNLCEENKETILRQDNGHTRFRRNLFAKQVISDELKVVQDASEYIECKLKGF